MQADRINEGPGPQDILQKKELEELERVDELDMAKGGESTIDPAEEKRLVRKLDFW